MKQQNSKYKRLLSIGTGIVIVWLNLCQPIAYAQGIKPYASKEDSLSECYRTAMVLDARLAICEQAHADSLIAGQKRDKQVAKTLKTAKRRAWWKGWGWGALIGVAVALLK